MNIYLLTDGMCESPFEQTSLELSYHPNLDKLTAYGRMGFYEPIIRDYVQNPETFIIFPFFFGLKKENNPGRAGLELFELGHGITKFQSFSIIRIVDKGYNIFNVLDSESIGSSWTKAPKLVNVEQIQKEIDNVESLLKTVRIIKSPRRDNVWSIGGINKTDVEDAINLIQFKLSLLGYNTYAMLMNDFQYKLPHIQKSYQTTFLGWGFSTLIEAFRFIGIHTNQTFYDIKNHLFDYIEKHRDFDENILPYLKNVVNTNESCILFFKEPSRAARENTIPDVKIEAIQFIDQIIGKLLQAFEGENINLIVLSDHQSNIGSKRTYSGPTLYYYGNLKTKINKENLFNEKSISKKVIKQQSLINKISKHIK